MSISTVANSIVDTVKNVSGTVLGVLKNVVQWAGRTISSGFNNYLVPTVQAIWNNLLPLLQKLGRSAAAGATTAFQFLRTGYGLGGGLVTVGLVLIINGYYENDHKTMIAKQLSGVALLALGVGVFAAFQGAQFL